MSKIDKEPFKHNDKLGKEIKVGSIVVYPDSNSLQIGTVKKINAKMLTIARVMKVGKWGGVWESRKYPVDVVTIEGPEVTMYVLKNC